jgi:hypothetical protein
MADNNIGWKIKVFTPNGQFSHWFVTSIKKNGISFSGSTHEDGAKIYRKKSNFQTLLDHFNNESVQYELIEVLC